MKITVAVLLLLASMAFAQKEPITFFSMGPSLGFYATPDTDSWNTIVGVHSRFKYNLLGAELAINYKSEQYNNDVVWVKSWPIRASVLLYPLPWVYAIGGIGYYDLYIDYNQNYDQLVDFENEAKQQWGAHAGLGVEKTISKTSILVVEMRYSNIDYDFTPFPTSSDIDTNALAIVTTLLFKFGVE